MRRWVLKKDGGSIRNLKTKKRDLIHPVKKPGRIQKGDQII